MAEIIARKPAAAVRPTEKLPIGFHVRQSDRIGCEFQNQSIVRIWYGIKFKCQDARSRGE
ncbi:hypothetical protein C7B69_10900 [filamentous cyanobacterium Phorm 46]|nr:hypothetical protein C7B69_10900 [filamentous cyanobacterium Phorm 46]PSB47758.1 hypothetical protein C7B67_18705 [filamentous cyanobacterium Phorm 6]